MGQISRWIGGGSLIAVVVNLGACGSPPPPLSDMNRKAIEIELAKKELPPPKSIDVDQQGFVVANYELSDEQLRQLRPLNSFGETALLVIRELLLPEGYYKNFRVNVNRTPPGAGLVRRFGSARYIDGGTVEWLTP